ncbi:uncharacterized protein F4812DRAFT_149165 [Daldinia caldariorum]|uniref:uncharacterized protein n=1 Tax=Daldinia caldariorum TaxID=326644 RepID=UPI0020081BB8|nr:uncharacterized protein F4812DRAFT_149165 [Daldinia caldariorum]KAI1464644.1 hypothetical protein F4812DRAFT_149165 [Daldinia caldariorum]
MPPAMSLSKQRISSPLEAGPSILDAYNLPSHLNEALEYTSKRLARKALHITLVVVRKEYQLPSVMPPCPTPTSPPLTPGIKSPTRFASPVVGLRQLVRRGTGNSTSTVSSTASDSLPSTAASSPSFPPPPMEPLISPRRCRWVVPPTPGTPLPRTPMTPQTPSSVLTASSTTSLTQGPNEFGIRLIHTSLLSPKAEKTLRTTISKAERKFRIGTSWLPPAATASACGLNDDLVRRSMLQNEVLFSSEGLTLLGLDRLYSFKSALAVYARSTYASPSPTPSSSSSAANANAAPTTTGKTPDSTRLEDAVDALRRLVLANGGRPVSKSDLLRSYDWLGANARALRDVESMYRRAYGGLDRTGAFETTSSSIPAATPPYQEEQHQQQQEEVYEEEEEGGKEQHGRSTRPVIKLSAPPPPRTPPRTQTTPVLTLDTQLATATTARIFKPTAKLLVPGTGKACGGGAAVSGKRGGNATREGMEIYLEGLTYYDDNEEEEEDADNSSDSGNKEKGREGERDEEGEGEGDYTARPMPGLAFWNNASASIDSMMLLSPSSTRESQQSQSQQRLGPLTPNGYDDISPVTRGEWGFLFKGEGWQQGRTAAVETW